MTVGIAVATTVPSSDARNMPEIDGDERDPASSRGVMLRRVRGRDMLIALPRLAARVRRGARTVRCDDPRTSCVAAEVLDEQAPEERRDARRRRRRGRRPARGRWRGPGPPPSARATAAARSAAHRERVLVAEDGLALHEAEELALADERARTRARPRSTMIVVDRRRGRAARSRRAPGRDALGAVHLADQVGLRGEVVVEPGHGHPGGVGELAHADGRGAPLGEEPQRRLHDPVAGGDRGGGTGAALTPPTYLNARSSAMVLRGKLDAECRTSATGYPPKQVRRSRDVVRAQRVSGLSEHGC